MLRNDLVEYRDSSGIGREAATMDRQERLRPIGIGVTVLVGCPLVGVVVLLGVLIATPVAGFALGAALATTLGLAFAMLMPPGRVTRT